LFDEAFCTSEGQAALLKNVTLLHCTSEYPARFEDVNLRAMQTLREVFGLATGISDHTPGTTVPVAAVTLGAVVVEKHFTLDRELPGPDHKVSLTPDELAAMVRGVREVEAALGSSNKFAQVGELAVQQVARKSLVAARPIVRGEVFSEENLAVKRPGGGVSPVSYWEMLGKVADRDYQPDELILL
jgi:N-acetylneuraminate synthase